MGDVEALAVEERKALAQAVKAGYDQPRHTLDGTLLIAAVETILTARLASRDARLAAVEALADEWEAECAPIGGCTPARHHRRLRAALHPDPSDPA